jgi:hypothetical protein
MYFECDGVTTETYPVVIQDSSSSSSSSSLPAATACARIQLTTSLPANATLSSPLDPQPTVLVRKSPIPLSFILLLLLIHLLSHPHSLSLT